MGTTQEEVDLGFLETGTQIKALHTKIGNLNSLTTSEKSSIIAAINEINAKTGSAGAQIDDTTPRTSTVYSSSKVDVQIEAAAALLKADILGGAGPEVDTLREIAELLSNSNSDVSTLLVAVANRIRFDEAQTLTPAQKVQANENIGSVSLAQFGDPAHSYRDTLLSAL